MKARILRSPLALMALLIGSLALAGCGGGDADSSTDQDRASSNGGAKVLQLDVEPGTLKFEKTKDSVAAGTVTLRSLNPDSTPHNIAIEGNGIKEEGELIADGKTSEITVDLKPGTYEYYCTPHRAAGMTGVLTVT